MKPLKILSLILAGFLVAGLAASQPASAGVSFDFFYSNLSPHGSWHVSASYGRVWQPAVYRTGWNPYYDGHWTYTDVGWCWNSDYAWGAVPYHYGTWTYDPFYGWVWVPGYTWAPSWVVFRQGPDYIGWAPVSPSFSVGVSFGFGSYPSNNFVFVHSGDFLCNRVAAYAVPASYTKVIVNKTTIINNNFSVQNNVVVNRGPSAAYIQNVTHRRIQAVPIERVRSVTAMPGRAFSRDLIRVDPQAARHGVRAAEPVSVRTPLPHRAQEPIERQAGGFGNASVGAQARVLGRPRHSPMTVGHEPQVLPPAHSRPMRPADHAATSGGSNGHQSHVNPKHPRPPSHDASADRARTGSSSGGGRGWSRPALGHSDGAAFSRTETDRQVRAASPSTRRSWTGEAKRSAPSRRDSAPAASDRHVGSSLGGHAYGQLRTSQSSRTARSHASHATASRNSRRTLH